MRSSRPGIAALVSLLVIPGCDLTTGEDPNRHPPAYPPLESLLLDLSFFAGRAPAPGGPTMAWDAADSLVASLAVGPLGVLAVPHALLVAADEESPYRSGDAWRWDFDEVIEGQRYRGYVGGGVHGVQFGYEIMVLEAPGRPDLTSYRWALGGFDQVGQHVGRWMLEDPDGPVDDIADELSFSRDWRSGDWAWEFRPQTGGVYTLWRDRSLGYLVTDPAARWQLTWNATTGTGGIQLGQAERLCWDANLHDVACSG